MFEGSQTLSIDNKGRISIPTKYRDALTPMVITPNPRRNELCLFIYPISVWNTIKENITALPNTDANLKVKRALLGRAETMTLDSNGRILVKPEFRKFAQLDKKIMLVGLGDKLELWDEATWEALYSDNDDGAYDNALASLAF